MTHLDYFFRFWVLTIMILASSCQNQSTQGNVSENSKNGVTGKYYSPISGAILFTIKKDSLGYYALRANNGRPSVRDSFRLDEFSEAEKRWNGFCGKSYDEWMSKHVIGGNDWRPNFYMGLSNRYNDFYFLNLKKGYCSDEHMYLTGYCMVSGSECFVSNIARVNIDKVK